MLLDVSPKNEDMVRTGPLLQQTPFWARVKELQGFSAAAFDVLIYHDAHSDSNVPAQNGVTDILVVLRSVGPGEVMAHVPYGPEFEPSEELQGHFLEELSEAMRPYLPEECFCIRYDLPWKSPWAEDSRCFGRQGEWFGPPRQEIQEIRMNMETETKNLRKSPTNILPVNTLFVDLQKNKKALLHQMKTKTRYNINLSQKKGVRVFEAGREELDTWYQLYKDTARRNNFVVHDKRYFLSMLKVGSSFTDRRISMHLLMAEVEGDLLAGMFLAISAKQAVYLYGASSRKKRDRMATYALQWDAICRAQHKGCSHYDMFGIAPSPEPSHPMHGLYRFKTGFGGRIFHRQGCWDYPLDPEKYSVYRGTELNDNGFHIKH